MTFLRNLSSALGRLSDRMQGQDVERPDLVHGGRFNADVAALARAHTSQGINSISMGR